MKLVTCKCGVSKWQGDPCAGCGKGLDQPTLRVRKNQPISLTTAHSFHAPTLVPSHIARALVRF